MDVQIPGQREVLNGLPHSFPAARAASWGAGLLENSLETGSRKTPCGRCRGVPVTQGDDSAQRKRRACGTPGCGAGARRGEPVPAGCSADLGGQRDEGQRASRWLRNMPTVLLPSGGRAACLCLARLASGRGNSAEVPRARKASGSVLTLPQGSLGSEKTPPRPVERAAWQGPEASRPPPPRAHVLQADRPALVQPADGTAPADTRCSPGTSTSTITITITKCLCKMLALKLQCTTIMRCQLYSRGIYI